MSSYISLLKDAKRDLAGDFAPDGMLARQALLLAERTAAVADSCPPGQAAGWDMFGAYLADAVAELEADLDDPAVLTQEVDPAGSDADELREEAAGLARWLADLYASAAAGEAGSGWRRLVWAAVARRLDDAAAELS
ncbi:hypothetical protein [Micromonospora sp. CPCC 206061]|uniref:hypothetical protein n=1 Tax=Micromonospora sp. CPCC 206061 TaxID=3122410 RepID=UPI002FF32EDE